MKAKEFFQSLKTCLEAASVAPEPLEALQKAIKSHYSDLFTKVQDGMAFVRKGGSLWLTIGIVGPGRFKSSENHNVGGSALSDFVPERVADQVAKDIAKLAGANKES